MVAQFCFVFAQSNAHSSNRCTQEAIFQEMMLAVPLDYFELRWGLGQSHKTRLRRALQDGKIAVYYVLSFSLADYYTPHNPPCRLLHTHNPPCRLLHTTQSTLQITTHHTNHLADYYAPHNPPCRSLRTTHSSQITRRENVHGHAP